MPSLLSSRRLRAESWSLDTSIVAEHARVEIVEVLDQGSLRAHRRRFAVALLSSLLANLGLIAFAYHWVEADSFSFAVQSGRNSQAAIEARFSLGELTDAPPTPHEIETKLDLPRAEQRTSPDAKSQLTALELLRPERRVAQAVELAQKPDVRPEEPPRLDVAPAHIEPPGSLALPHDVAPPSLARADRNPQVQIEKIEQSVASAGSVASVAEQGSNSNDPPRPLVNPAPIYPAEALQQRLAGRVVLRVMIEANGRVTNVMLQQSSGSPLLDEAARAAVEQWRFEPTRKQELLVPFRFVIPDQPVTN